MIWRNAYAVGRRVWPYPISIANKWQVISKVAYPAIAIQLEAEEKAQAHWMEVSQANEHQIL